MMIRKQIFLFSFLCLFLFLVKDAHPFHSVPGNIQVVRQDQSGIHLRVNFDKSFIDDPQNLASLIHHTYLICGDSIKIQPQLSCSFIPFTTKTDVQILTAEYTTFQHTPLSLSRESSIDTSKYHSDKETDKAGYVEKSFGDLPKRPLIELSNENHFRNIDIRHAYFFPLQPSDQNNTFRFYDHIEIKLNFNLSAPLAEFGQENLSAEIVNKLNRNVINHSSWKFFRQQVKSPFRKSKKTLDKSYPLSGCNIVVSQDGWYHITYSALKQAGVPIDFLNPKKIQLFYKGEEIPLYISGETDGQFDSEDTIEFWGIQNRNTDFPEAEELYYDSFCKASVYILTWGMERGLRYGTHVGNDNNNLQPAQKPRYFTRPIHIEEDQRYDRLGWSQAGDFRDHWFYSQSIVSGEMRNFQISLPKSYPYSLKPIKLKLWFHGRTQTSHRVEVYLNQRYIGECEWYGPDKYQYQTEIINEAGTVLEADQHKLTIVNRSSEELDFVLFNWLEIEYPQAYEAENDYLLFTAPKNQSSNMFQFRLKNFSTPDIQVYKINAYQILNIEILETIDSLNNVSYQVQFTDESYSPQDRYLAISSEQKLSPDTLYSFKIENDLKEPENQAGYLIITHSKFVSNPKLQEFIHWRERDYSVKLATVETIYQQFNDGIPSPLGIKKFIMYTQTNWKKPSPMYVLLIGDGYNRKIRLMGNTRNFVPVYNYQTYKFGAAVSDPWYVTNTKNNLFPDVYIGRWPVNTFEELEMVINKTMGYEQASSEFNWQNSLLMIAGNGHYFRDQTSNIINQIIPPPFFTERIHSSPINDPFYGSTEKLTSSWNNGLTYINFRGHGGGAVWSDNLLFQFEDVERLHNQNKLPFITSMTCFTCAFDGNRPSLGESLILYEEGGAVAILGASGVGWVWNDYYLLREILQVMFTQPHATLGSIVHSGKLNYAKKYMTPQLSSNIQQYNLIGDPGLVFKLPWKDLELSLPKTGYDPGDTLFVQTNIPTSTVQLAIRLYNEEGLEIVSTDQMIDSNKKTFSLDLPEDLDPGKYQLKIFGSNLEQQWFAHGAVPFQIKGISVDQIWIDPIHPTAHDPIQITAQCLGLQTNDSSQVYFTYWKSQKDSIQMKKTDRVGFYQVTLPIGFAQVDDQIPFCISIYTNEQHIKSEMQTLRISENPDFAIIPSSFGLVPENGHLYLTINVRNQSNFIADSLPIHFWSKSSSDSEFVFIGEDTIQLNSYENKDAKTPWHFTLGQYNIKIQIDPDSLFTDIDFVNNVLTNKFTSKQMRISESMIKDDVLQCRVLPNYQFKFYNASSLVDKILVIDHQEEVHTKQSQLKLHRPNNWPSPVTYIGFRNEQDNASLTANLNFSVDSLTVDTNHKLSLYQYYEDERKWATVLDQTLEKQVLRCNVNRLGKFAFFYTDDHTPPNITISPQNRGFYNDGYVQKNSLFTIRIEDASGAHPDISQLKMMLNGQPMIDDQYHLKRQYENKTLIAQLEIHNISGKNVIQAKGFDCNGNNASSNELRFKVSENLDIFLLGNYPNPFTDQTIFCYELTGIVKDLRLKIYTNSGQLVQTISSDEILDDPDPLSVGYHEVTWRGLDKYGDDIANGVYFYQFVIKGEEKTVKKRGKLARIR